MDSELVFIYLLLSVYTNNNQRKKAIYLRKSKAKHGKDWRE